MIYLLTIILFITQLGDWWTTHTILERGGYEVNPIMKKLFDVFGVDITFCIKGMIVTQLGFYLGLQNIWYLGATIALYVIVLANNLYQLRK